MLSPPIPLGSESRIGLALVASVTDEVSVRILVSSRPDRPPVSRFLGSVSHSAGDRTVESTFLDTGGGWLWSVLATTSGAIDRGALLVLLTLANQQSQRDFRLAQGYVYEGRSLGDGEFTEPGPGGGEGLFRSIDLGDPAAGADYTAQTVPTNALWRLLGFQGQLVTDGTAVSRHPILTVTDGTDVVAGTAVGYYSPASNTGDYLGSVGGHSGGAFTSIGAIGIADSVGFTMPEGPYPEGYVVTFTTQTLQAGDDWGDGQLFVEEWLVL